MTKGRFEDPRLLRGEGLYVSDALTAQTAFAGFVRSDSASAKLLSIDVEQALEIPGVLAVYTAADLEQDGVAWMGHEPLPRDDGGKVSDYPVPVLVGETVRHIGEPLAIVVAEDRGALADGIEAVWVEMEDVAAPEGVCFHRNLGDAEAVDAAFARASHRTRITLDIPRATVTAMEPRGIIVRPEGDGLHIRSSSQNPFALRSDVAAHFGLAKEAIHVEAKDVGGSFGLKGPMMREDAAVVFAARKLGRELAWISTRSEALLADAQGRAVTGEVELGFDADQRLIALRGDFTIDAGAYPSRRAMGLVNNINGFTGMYEVQAVAATVTGRLSPRPPLAPFRGNGRPEAAYAIERGLDRAAREMGLDPVELRRKNLVQPEAMPFTTGLGTVLDCGDFPAVMDRALDTAGDAAERRADAEAKGLLYGVGLANCIESAAGPIRKPKPDFARIVVDETGRVVIAPGVMSVGQGHETTMSQIAAERLGLAVEQIGYANGDTAALSNGRGSGGSSGLAVAGSALAVALDELIAEGRAAAAAEFGCTVEDIAFSDGVFRRSGSNENLSLGAIAALKGGRWELEAQFLPPAATFPNGTHICEVEIDPETGECRITRYAAVEDVGRVMNPMLVEGQLHGGAAMGLSIALGEQVVYDEDGQLLTGSFMDYRMARADDVPVFRLGTLEVPTQMNPLGVKGVGEAGTVGSTAAFASAVSDALARAGVQDFELPATPFRIWEALRAAGAGA